MSEIIALGTLILVIFFQGYQLYDQKKSYEKRISDLLDRVMSKDYPQYIQAEVAREQSKLPPEPYEERGIPI